MTKQEVAEDQSQEPDTHEQQLMKSAETLQEILFFAGAAAIGIAGVVGWKLIHLPWPFFGLPCIGVAAGIPWLWTIFIHEEEACEMGATAFREKLIARFMQGVWGGFLTALVVVALFTLFRLAEMWPTSIL